MTTGKACPGRFSGSAALVTGAAHGIGRACAERLAAEGSRVAVADVDLAAAERAVATLPAPERHLAVGMNVTDAGAVTDAVRRAAEHFDGLDVLVTVAGGDTAHEGFEGADDAIWHQMLDLNLVSVARCCRTALPLLRRSTRSPAIVVVTSVNGLVAMGSEPYSSAKAGVGSLVQNLAAGLGGDGIRVNAVAPGTIRTRNWDGQPGGADRMEPLYVLGRVGEPEDVAGAVCFLASTDASWITGQVLPVDGGLLAGTTLLAVRGLPD